MIKKPKIKQITKRKDPKKSRVIRRNNLKKMDPQKISEGVKMQNNTENSQTNSAKRKKTEEEIPAQNENSASQNQNDNGNNFASKTDYKYREGDTGPFRVHVEYIEQNREKGISQLTIGQIIYRKMRVEGVTQIKLFNRKTVTVYFSNSLLANNFTDNESLKNYNLKAYIPGSYVFVSGIVRGIDYEVDLDELKEDLANYDVYRLERMTRAEKGQTDRIPTKSVKIVFRANRLPEEVEVYNTKLIVSPFVGRVKQCRKCWRFGHYSDGCKSRVTKCVKCGSNEHNDGTMCQVRCLHCGGNHEASFEDCTVRTKQKNIKFIMAKENMGYFEVLDRYPTYTSNKFDLLQGLTEFPELPPTQSYSRVTRGVTPRDRAVIADKIEKTKSFRKPQEPKRVLPTAEQQDWLGGPSLNVENPHKTTELEKLMKEIEQTENRMRDSLEKSEKLAEQVEMVVERNTSNGKELSDWDEIMNEENGYVEVEL